MNEIDINRADIETLSRLDGIGDKLAARIVTYRETVHPFEEIIELAAVPGISERMVRAIAGDVTVGALPLAPDDTDVELDEALAAEATVVALPQVSPGAEMDAPVLQPSAAETAEDMLEPEPEGDIVADEEPADVDVILLSEEPEDGEEVPVAASAGARGDVDDLGVDEIDGEPDIAGEEEADGPVEPVAGPSEEPFPETLPPPETPAPPARRGCSSLMTTLLAVLLGALLGAGLTLLLLYSLNGTLDFASPAQVARLQEQVETQNVEQSGLDEDLDALSARIDEVSAAEATTAAGLAESAAGLEQEVAELEQTVTGDVATLEAETAAIGTRVDTLSAASENFDLFLDGMRNLLIDLRGLPPLPTATPTPALTTTATVTATGTVATPTPDGTPTVEGTATATPFVTRTPRPTATPLVSPTPTAVNIP